MKAGTFMRWLATLLLLTLALRILAQPMPRAQADSVFLPVVLKNFDPTSENLASMSGELYTFLGAPIRGTTFYLTQRLWWVITGPRDGDIVSITDREGRFTLTDVPPGDYYILVWAPYNWVYVPVSEDNLFPRLFAFEPNVNHDLGRVEMVWP